MSSARAPRVAHAIPAVAVYREAYSSDRTRLYFSYRSVEEAAQFGWARTGVAFYAFASQAPGTVLVYAESPTTAPHARYNCATRRRDEAARASWAQLGIAFWV